jgi:hypothetical protein
MKQSDVNPHSIQSGRRVDERGSVSFVSGFGLKGVDRFYWVQAGHANVPSGWG